MLNTDLIRIGDALYGQQRWHTALARDLGVSYRTICRWVAGTTPIDATTAETLRMAISFRIAQLQRASLEVYGRYPDVYPRDA